MSWSKVNRNTKKPIGWWYNKILCEFVWFLGNRGKHYYKYLDGCCKYGFNLYGDKIK